MWFVFDQSTIAKVLQNCGAEAAEMVPILLSFQLGAEQMEFALQMELRKTLRVVGQFELPLLMQNTNSHDTSDTSEFVPQETSVANLALACEAVFAVIRFEGIARKMQSRSKTATQCPKLSSTFTFATHFAATRTVQSLQAKCNILEVKDARPLLMWHHHF
jgi:hypothetical protein